MLFNLIYMIFYGVSVLFAAIMFYNLGRKSKGEEPIKAVELPKIKKKHKPTEAEIEYNKRMQIIDGYRGQLNG